MPRYEWKTIIAGTGVEQPKTAYVIPWPRRAISWATDPTTSHAKTPPEGFTQTPTYNCICGHICQNIHDIGSPMRGVSQPQATGCCRCRAAQLQFRVPLGPPFQSVKENTEDNYWVRPDYADLVKEQWHEERTWKGFSAQWTKRRFDWHVQRTEFRCATYHRAHKSEGQDAPSYLSTKDYGLVPGESTLAYRMKQGKLVEHGYYLAPHPVLSGDTCSKDGAKFYKEAVPQWQVVAAHYQNQPAFADVRHLGWHAGLYRPVLLQREGWWTDQHTARKQVDFLGMTSGAKDSRLNKMCTYCQVTAKALPPYLFWMARGYTKAAAKWMAKNEQKIMEKHLKAGRIKKGVRKFSWGVLPGVNDVSLLPSEMNANHPD
jgi:hypothetical protein